MKLGAQSLDFRDEGKNDSKWHALEGSGKRVVVLGGGPAPQVLPERLRKRESGDLTRITLRWRRVPPTMMCIPRTVYRGLSTWYRVMV